MAALFLDTNVLIRYLTQDQPDHAAGARTLFEQAGRREVTLHLSEAVIVEAANVLSSRVTYNLPRAEIQRHLENIFALGGLRLPQKRTYRRALALWVATPAVRDFADALHVAHMERLKIAAIASFDTDFDRFPQIKRHEPGRPLAT